MTRPPIVVLSPAVYDCSDAKERLEAAGYVVVVAEGRHVTLYSDEAIGETPHVSPMMLRADREGIR